MRLGSPRTLAAAGAVLALAAGGATAFAASGSGSPGSHGRAIALSAGAVGPCGMLPPRPPLGDPLKAAADYVGLSVDELAQRLSDGKSLADVATAQGKTVDGLKQALLDAAKAGLDEDVASGDMTADEEQQTLAQIRSQLDDFVSGKGRLSIRIGGGKPGLDVEAGGPFKAAADYLGLSGEQVKTELEAGKSLAEIATEHGKSVDGLEQALVAAATADIQKAVAELVEQKGLPAPPCGAVKVTAAGKLRGGGGFGFSIMRG